MGFTCSRPSSTFVARNDATQSLDLLKFHSPHSIFTAASGCTNRAVGGGKQAVGLQEETSRPSAAQEASKPLTIAILGGCFIILNQNLKNN